MNGLVGGAQGRSKTVIGFRLHRLAARGGGTVIRDRIPMRLACEKLSGERCIVEPLLVDLLHLDLLTENVALQHM